MAELEAPAATAPAAPTLPVLFKARGRGKANLRKRSPSPPPRASESDSDSDADADADGGSDGGLRGVKRRKRTGAGGRVSASTAPSAAASEPSAPAQPLHVADRSALLADSDAATKQSHLYDGALADKPKRGGAAAAAAAATLAAATSSGPAPTPGARPTRIVGPVKAMANIRTITITDFAPDVCKDYKLTGFCGFGDNCKFLHAREDYKQGWQLDHEWEAVTKGKKNLGGTVVASADRRQRGPAAEDGGRDGGGGDDDDDDDEALLRDIPFACILCQEPYRQPVVTRCGHYFCERCALQRYRRDPTCAACGAATTGVFNTAKRLNKLLARKRARAAQRRQAAIEAGEDVSSSEEEEGGE